MGFMDKVKEQAANATAAAKDAASKGQSKLDTMQANKAADALLRDLGAAVYAQQTGRGNPQTDEAIGRICDQLRQHEATYGPVQLTTATSASVAPAGMPQAADAGVPASAAPDAPAPAAATAPAPAGAAPPPPPTGVSL